MIRSFFMSITTPTLHTTSLKLRPFTESDTDTIFALHSNPTVLRYWDAPPYSERAQAERFIMKSKKMAEENRGVRLAIEHAVDGNFLGWCAFFNWNPEYRSAGIGYCFDETAWGKGYATEAAKAVLHWAFENFDLNRVQAEADTRNIASGRVLEKLGFVLEGTLREDCIVNGDVSDSWVYGLLKKDWDSLQF